MEGRLVTEEYVDEDLLEDTDMPRVRSRGQVDCVDTVAAGAGLSSWRVSGGWERVDIGGRPSREPCLMLSCRGREKFPTIMAPGATAGCGGGWRSTDEGSGWIGEVFAMLGKGLGLSEGGRESSVELDVRPGAMLLGTNG
jgi:hypothetical protein